jgi:flagellar hook-basal body complex protein FliE
MASPLAAASAYANIARLATNPSQALGNPAGAGQGAASGAGSFADMLKSAIGSVSETGHKSDAQMQAVANGKSNMVDVVTAVAETEVAVSAVVAVRDKVIQAYDEIMKMPI